MAVRGLKYDEPAAGPDVAVDEVGSPPENYQLLKPAFGVAGDAKLVHAGQPLPARDYHGGAAAYDTGRVAVLAASTLITAAGDIWVDLLLLINLSDQDQNISVTDGSNASYGQIALKPNEWRLLPLEGLLFSGGVKLAAAALGVAVAQLKGTR